jgi:hypothetical protein
MDPGDRRSRRRADDHVASVLWSAHFRDLLSGHVAVDTVTLLLIRLTPLPEPLFVTMSGMRYAALRPM